MACLNIFGAIRPGLSQGRVPRPSHTLHHVPVARRASLAGTHPLKNLRHRGALPESLGTIDAQRANNNKTIPKSWMHHHHVGIAVFHHALAPSTRRFARWSRRVGPIDRATRAVQ